MVQHVPPGGGFRWYPRLRGRGLLGDWSRIGAISTELEAKLRFYALVLLGVHVVAAAAAGKVAQSRGLPVAPAVGKTFAVGFLAFLETCFKTAPGKA